MTEECGPAGLQSIGAGLDIRRVADVDPAVALIKRRHEIDVPMILALAAALTKFLNVATVNSHFD
jgi:hypothetical protein